MPMRIDIIWNEETTAVDLADGLVTVGGATGDGIHIAGLPHGLLELKVAGEQMSVTARRSLRIGQALFPARVPRLLIAGEEMKLPNDVIIRRVVDAQKQASRKHVATAFVAQELLSGGVVDVQHTRAATFVCVTGYDQGRVFPIPFGENVIGRADDATIRVRDRAVSRQQALLVRKGRDYVLEPITSAMNAAYVNGKRLKKPLLLRTGDVLEMGQSVLRFEEAARAPEEKTFVEPAGPKTEPESPAALAKVAPRPPPQDRRFDEKAVVSPRVEEPSVEVSLSEPIIPSVVSLAEPSLSLSAIAPRPAGVTLEVLLMSAGLGLMMLGAAAALVMMGR